MTESSTPPPETDRPSNPDLLALQKSADQLESQLVELGQTARVARAQLWTMVILLVGIITFFGYSSYSRMKANFSRENTRLAIEKVTPELQPLVLTQAQALADELYPVYLAEIQKKMSAAGPGLAEDALRELELLPDKCNEDLQEMIDDTFTRITDILAPELAKTFPKLTKEEVSQRLGEHLHVAVQDNADDLHAHLQGLFQNELDLFGKSMSKFETPEGYASKTNEELNYLMLHHMFELMDDATTNPEEGDYFDFVMLAGSDDKSRQGSKKPPAEGSPSPAPKQDSKTTSDNSQHSTQVHGAAAES